MSLLTLQEWTLYVIRIFSHKTTFYIIHFEFTIKASLGERAEGRTRAAFCLSTRDANPYEHGTR